MFKVTRMVQAAKDEAMQVKKASDETAPDALNVIPAITES